MSKNAFVCDCHPLDEALVAKAREAMPREIESLAEFFAMVGDPTRCKLLFALKTAPLCVCDLANVLSMTKSSVSHQLNKMKAAGLVTCQRQGKQVFYCLDDDHVLDILELSRIHLQHREDSNHEK